MLRLTCASIVLGGVLSTAPGAEFDLSWYSIDGGGVLHSSGGAFDLSGTIGQPDAGTLSGATFQLTGGFWLQIAPTDCNEDGAVNLIDHSSFTDCLTGPIAGVGTSCNCFDSDRDGNVDLRDFAEVQIDLSSP